MKNFLFILLICLSLLACSKETSQRNYLFQKIDPKISGLDFKNVITEDSQHSIINYIYYYNGGGVAVGDINNDSLPDLFFVSNMGKNKLYLNKGNFTFEDVSDKANIAGNSSWNTGATIIDINNDGFLDIYVCSVSGLLDFKGHNELFINNGDGTFTESSKDFGLDFEGYSTQAYFFDYDKDDDLDVYIVNHAIHTTLSHGPASIRNKRTPLVGDVLMRNDNGKFTDVSEEANIFGGVNGYGLSASIADFNNDGWDDIYVCNDFHEDDYYYINNQDGTFEEKLGSAFSTISRFSMGSDAADINADGMPDLITLDMLPKDEKTIKETEGDDAMFNMQVHLRKLGYKDQYSRNMLQINNADGSYFHETALFNEISDTDWSWGPLIEDFNNDGNQDLFIANGILRRPNGLDFRKYVASAFKNRNQKDGLEWLFKSIDEMPKGESPNEIFQGNSTKFINKTGEWIENEPSLSNGSVYVDLDRDGDLDLVTNNLNSFAGLYKNTSDNTNNYLSLKLEYKKGNFEGIGSKAIVYYDGHNQIKQLFKSRGFLSSVNGYLHFGLGQNSVLDSIAIIWPNNQVQIVQSPKINSIMNISYAPNSTEGYYKNPVALKEYPFEKTEILDYIHQEDNYNDYVSDKLIPYKVSTTGPAVAVADIDGNGFEDVFLGGASGQKASIYINNGESLISFSSKAIEEDSFFEDNDAEFFDADNDGDLDLYVASGINKNRIKKFENDRLYLNNGNQFERSNQIPDNFLNTSCVRANDFDNDGDVDLFIGNLSNPKKFGGSVESSILINDGKGNFNKANDFKLISKVTNALWYDINKDGFKDLLVSTEWDSPKIYINEKGKLKPLEIPEKLNGLWQTISVYDFDKDGDEDIMLGNWGLNTRFKASADAPLLMYFSDFDSNNVSEAIIAYNVDGKNYPLNSKDELASQMNIISKRFVKHEDFALKTIEEVLTKEALSKAQKFEVHTLASGILKNNNGKFDEFLNFPDQLQLAPINSFKKINLNGKECLLVGGNSLRVTTYHGSYTSLKGYIFESLNNIEPITKLGIDPFHNQIKALETIKLKDKDLLLVIPNNDSLKTYSYNKNEH